MRNRVAIVTGAARGIGQAVARRLAEEDSCVAMVDSDAAGLRVMVEKLRADGLHATAYPTDVTSSVQVEATVSAVENELGPIEWLANVAGVLRLGTASRVSDDDLAATFAVNVNGVCYMSRAVVNRMVPRGHGAIVTVASNAAGTPRTEMAAYAASKAASAMFTRCLGLEVAGHGIRCNVVAPGSTDTDMLRSMWHDESGPVHTLEGSLSDYRTGIPLRKLAGPADIAEAVQFLLSDRAGHITMHSLTVDGGATLGV